MSKYNEYLKCVGILKKGYMPTADQIASVEGFFVCRMIEEGEAYYFNEDYSSLCVSIDNEVYSVKVTNISSYLTPEWCDYIKSYIPETPTPAPIVPEPQQENLDDILEGVSSYYNKEENQSILKPAQEEISSILSSDITYVAVSSRISRDKQPSYMTANIIAAPIDGPEMGEYPRLACWYEINGRSGTLISGYGQPVYITDGENTTYLKASARYSTGGFALNLKGVDGYSLDNRVRKGGSKGHIIIKDEGISVHVIPKNFNVVKPQFFYIIERANGEQLVGDNVNGVPVFYHNGVPYNILVKWEEEYGNKTMSAAVAPAQ